LDTGGIVLYAFPQQVVDLVVEQVELAAHN
jgi:hypothetical protein